MSIKNAAVPHYSKSNGKIVYAVRVCPADLVDEPYTVYRTWHDFGDFSAKLASVFPASTPDPDERAIFRRVPRLSRKVTLFVTASTHASRRDELDLFVRHLFNLPTAVTSHRLVEEFFDIKPNGLDGQLPPSPTPLASPNFENKTVGPGAIHRSRGENVYASIRERSPTGATLQNFRPTLGAKRSTPDLRQFIASSDSSDGDMVDSMPSPFAPSPLTWKFPSSPAAAAGSIKPVVVSPVDSDETVRFSAHQANASTSGGNRQRAGLAIDTFEEPATAAREVAGSPSDASSMRTASTIRPVRSRSSSRIASPLSFASDLTEDDHAAPVKPRPGPGALKHFRSLQDIRSVVTPRPQLPTQAHSHSYVPPPMTRTRSDSKILSSKPLPQVAEDDSPIPSPTTSSSSRGFLRKGTVKAQTVGGMRFRPSLDNLRRAQQSFNNAYGHKHTPSNSSIESCDSSSSVSLSRSQSSSAGLGLDFSSSSYESLDLSDHSCLGSPDSSFAPPTTPPASASSYDGRFEHEQWQHDASTGGYHYNNHIPPLPFFPTPAACDYAKQTGYHYQQSQNGSSQSCRRQGRKRASSLHQPVLETILASPLLGTEAEPSVTVKLMTAKGGNFLMKVPRSASLREVREKVFAKCKASDVKLAKGFGLAVNAAAAGGANGADTAKSSGMLDGGSAVAAQTVDLEDEEDWQLALSLATTKITLRVL